MTSRASSTETSTPLTAIDGKVLLQRALHQNSAWPRPRGSPRLEHQLQHAGAELGAVHPLAGGGEQQLLDQVADVFRAARAAVRRRPSKW